MGSRQLEVVSRQSSVVSRQQEMLCPLSPTEP